MKKILIVLHHFKEWHNLSYPVIFSYMSIFMNIDIFERNNIQIISLKTFLDKDDIKKIDDSNVNRDDNFDYKFYIEKAMINLINIMRNSDIYNESILIGFQNIGSDLLFYRKDHCKFDFYDVLKSKNCKTIIWIDDLHGFPGFPKVFDYKNDKNYSNLEDYRFDLANIILTPSRFYFDVLKSKYISKSLFYFYCLNEEWYDKIELNDWNLRDPKILLSGACGENYPIRLELYNIYQSFSHHHEFKKLISYLHTPGYNRNHQDFSSKVGLNYLKNISKYKGAFFAYAEKPLNFNLAKIIEILMCGTIGFFQYSDLLEKELGLIKYKHYVPITNEKNELITDVNYYLNYLNSDEGQQIALNGANYVRNIFKSENRINQLVDILNNLY